LLLTKAQVDLIESSPLGDRTMRHLETRTGIPLRSTRTSRTRFIVIDAYVAYIDPRDVSRLCGSSQGQAFSKKVTTDRLCRSMPRPYGLDH